MNDDDGGAWVYYKLTCEPTFGSGELKKSLHSLCPQLLEKLEGHIALGVCVGGGGAEG